MLEGRNPRDTARDVIGRTARATGRREGGIIGLTSGQAEWVRTARAELASGDPALMRNYLTRARRDERFDGAVKRAIAEGRPLSASEIEKRVTRYSQRLLAYRGEVVARTETLHSVHAGQYESMQQLVDSGSLQRSQVRFAWSATGDGRTRDSHLALHGEMVTLGETFVSPATRARMRYPGDTSLGAQGQDVIQCRCTLEPRINFLANVR